MFGRYSMTNVAWSASVEPLPDYLPWSPVDLRASQCCVHDKLLYRRR